MFELIRAHSRLAGVLAVFLFTLGLAACDEESSDNGGDAPAETEDGAATE